MTEYFKEQVLRKRLYLKPEWIWRVFDKPLRVEEQSDGRIRYWGYIDEAGGYLRVVTLSDGQTVHNAFLDRDFEEQP